MVENVKAEERNCLFHKSLLGTIIQDSSIRERRGGSVICIIADLLNRFL